MLENSSDFAFACKFYESNVNKHFFPTYDQKILLSALFKQIKHGPFLSTNSPAVGMFDFIGKERRAKWLSLGEMTKPEAEDMFIQILTDICPQFSTDLEAYPITPTTCTKKVTETPMQSENSELNWNAQESQIRAALNAQTMDQFNVYAVNNHPDDPEKQKELIENLQNRHFHQYMNCLYENQSSSLPFACNPKNDSPPPTTKQTPSNLKHVNEETGSISSKQNHLSNVHSSPLLEKTPNLYGESQLATTGETQVDLNLPAIVRSKVPNLWARKDIADFKSLFAQEPESVLNVGSGELVTIRVPVDLQGNTIVWEYATDDNDIGFGLFFERKQKHSTSPQLENSKSWNLIKASSTPIHEETQNSDSKEFDLIVDEILPIERQSSQNYVCCGSHTFEGKGTYLLKFDNTYSLWRSKVLYYRVYCTQ